MRLQLSTPERLTAFFAAPADRTPWDGRYTDGKSGVRTPDRARATFRTIGHSLESHGRPGLPHPHGIYVLAFAVPYPAIYIGIAANDGRAPEGIASRMRKHWVKATGSHVSDRPGAGGVHHPTAWADFALDRFTHMRSAGEADTLADAVIMTGSIDGGANRKNVCLYYEGQLTRPGPLRAKLIHAIFGGAVQAPSLLNAARFARCHAEDDASVSFGTGETVRLED